MAMQSDAGERSDSRLAIDGGQPVLPEGVPRWPIADEQVRQMLAAVYADGSWGCYEGPYTDRLVEALTRLHQVRYALPCCSGTFAVELALRAAGILSGEEVILAGYDFPGNFRAIEAIGAQPVLVDIDPRNWCLDAQQVELALEADTRAIIVSHLHGGMADMQKLCQVARAYDLVVVEDACQTPGGIVQGRIAGTWGEVGVVSFGGSKLLTAGRGGAIVTDDERIYQRAKVACQRGNDAFPMSQLQAAVLLPQFEQLADRNRRRFENAGRLLRKCRGLDALEPIQLGDDSNRSGFYKIAWRYLAPQCGDVPREAFVDAVRAEGVAIGTGFHGFNRRGARRCRRHESLDASHDAAEQTVLLHHPVLLEEPETIDRVADALEKVVHHFQHCRPRGE